jgi:hypothetical protein
MQGRLWELTTVARGEAFFASNRHPSTDDCQLRQLHQLHQLHRQCQQYQQYRQLLFSACFAPLLDTSLSTSIL